MASDTKLTNYDWFSIITGIIGLIADILALLALFYTQSEQDAFFTLRLIVPSLTVLTTIIVGVLIRKSFVSRNRREKTNLLYQDYLRIERGATALTIIFCLALSVTYVFSLSGIEELSVSPNKRENYLWFGIGGLILGFILSITLNYLCKLIYLGLDVKYEPKDMLGGP